MQGCNGHREKAAIFISCSTITVTGSTAGWCMELTTYEFLLPSQSQQLVLQGSNLRPRFLPLAIIHFIQHAKQPCHRQGFI